MADDERIQLAALLGGTAASVVGQRLSLKIGKVNCPGIVIAYFPRTQKHRIRLMGTDGSSREKNFRLQEVDHKLLEDGDAETSTTATPPPTTSSLDLAIRRDAVGRQLEIYHQVRQKWYKGTILRYVEHCQQHAIILEPQGKVHLVDLSEQAWRFTDLIATAAETASSSDVGTSAAGPLQTPDVPDLAPPGSSSLATSKYMGVQRFTESTWKAYYVLNDDTSDVPEELYIGCFGTEKDAALAYDVYARKRGTPVNFGDRRICKRGIKLLIVPEPEPEPEPPAVAAVLPESTTSNDLESTTATAIATASATSTTPSEPSPESTASNVDLIQDDSIKETVSTGITPATSIASGSVTNSTSDSDAPPLLMEEKTEVMDTASTSAAAAPPAPAKVEEEEDNDKSVTTHPMVDMTDEADIVPEPTSVPHRRISVNDEDDSDDESVVCTKKQQKHRKRKKSKSSPSSMITTKPTTAKKPAVNAVEEDSSDEESEFEFCGNDDMSEGQTSQDEDSTSSGDSSSDSDDESLAPPSKRRPSKLKQMGKKRTKPTSNATANLFESSSDEEEEEERMIARKLKRKGARALRELEDFNEPGRTEKKKKKHKRKKDNNKKSTGLKKRKSSDQGGASSSSSSREPRYPVGTRFLKDFPDHGVFEGRITEWTGKYYEVFYPEDEDRETLAEEDFEDFEILSIPKKRTSSSSIEVGKKKKKRRKQAYIE